MNQKHYLLIIFIFYLYTRKRYTKYLPTIPLYPNNYNESLIVKDYINKRSFENISLFHKTDDSVIHAFKPYVNESLLELRNIITQKHIFFSIFFIKYLFNRARPKQINPDLNVLESKTADTPAFPSGHAFQGYYLANYLSNIYPHKTKLLNDIAEKCALARVHAGLHYPSDNQFSKLLVDYIFNIFIIL